MPKLGRYSTRVLLSAAAIGAASGIFVVALNYFYVLLPPVSYLYAFHSATIGVWTIGALVAMALFRMPGIALLTCAISGVVNFVAPAGFAQFMVFLVAGVLIELPFAVVLYRRWSDRWFWIAYPFSVIAMSTVYYLTCLAAGLFDPIGNLVVLTLVVAVVAVAVALGLTAAALGVARKLRAAGLGPRSTDQRVQPR